MSVYVLLEYIEECKKNEDNPTLKGLKKFKKEKWRE